MKLMSFLHKKKRCVFMVFLGFWYILSAQVIHSVHDAFFN